MTKRHGSKFERRGMRLAVILAVVGVLVIGYFLVTGNGSSGPGSQAQPVPPPPPAPGQIAAGPSGLMAGEGMEVQFTDPEDPSKVTGELRSKSVEPLEARRYLVVEPEMWLYQDDGSSVMVRAAKGRLHMPSRSQEPESGRLEGGVVVHMYEPRGDGSRVTRIGDDEPSLVAETEWLEFDMALGEASTDASLQVDTEQMSFFGRRIRARFDELREQLVFLDVVDGGYVTYLPEEDADSSPAPPPTRVERAPRDPARANAAPRPPREASEAPGPLPEPVLYYALIEQGVVLEQEGRALEADMLEIWVRTFDNALREGAIRPIEFADTQAPRVHAPTVIPFIPAVASLAIARAQPEPSADLITLTWDGPLRVQPVDEAAELLDDDLAFRFSSTPDSVVTLHDDETGARGELGSLSYLATTSRADASGAASAPGWIDSPEHGRLEFEHARVDLANGLVNLTGQMLARAAESSSEIRCDNGADLALHFLGTRVTGLLREAIFNGNVVATNGEASAIGEIARASFALEEGDEGTTSRLEHFYLEGTDDAVARLVQSDDESLQGRVIDVSLVPGPDDEPDPSIVAVRGDVVGRQGDAELTCATLEALLSRNEDGELVVDKADAGGGVRFVRASDDIEVVADALQAWPEEERATFAGEDSMVRRRSASVHGRQIELDGAARRINVFGAGRFDDELGSGAVASWSREMSFDDERGELQCHGDVVAVITRDERTRDTIRALRIFATLEPVDGEQPEASGLDALDGSLDDLVGERRLVSAVAIGEIEEIEDGLPAIIQSIANDVVLDDDGNETVRTAQALLLEGPRIELNDGGDRLNVPAAGRLVVADRREPSEPASEDDVTAARGQAMFTWTGFFDFDRSTGEAVMQRGARATMIEPDVSRVTLLDAERLTALLTEDETDQPTLTGARAEGAVYLAQKSDGLTSFEVIADRLSLDNVAKTAEATSAEGNVVTVFEGGRPTPATASMFFFNLEDGRWEIRDPGTITTPR